MNESANPFESPNAPAGGGQQRTEGIGEFDIGVAFQEGWETTKSDVGLWLGAGLVSGIVAMVAATTIIGYFVVVPVIMYGGVRFTLNMHDRKAEFGDIFSGFQNFGPVLGRFLLLILVNIGILIPGYLIQGIGIAMESTAIALLSQLVILGISFGVLPRLYFTPFYIVDQDMGTMDAVRMSWEATSALWGRLVLFMLASAAAAIVGMLACFVGIIPASALIYFAWASAYRQIAGRPADLEGAAAGAGPWANN